MNKYITWNKYVWFVWWYCCWFYTSPREII